MDEEQREQQRREQEINNPLVKLVIFALIGLVMWMVFGRIGGHPFPH